ncbi:unnamed protein product [Lampetra fluviatilis]
MALAVTPGRWPRDDRSGGGLADAALSTEPARHRCPVSVDGGNSTPGPACAATTITPGLAAGARNVPGRRANATRHEAAGPHEHGRNVSSTMTPGTKWSWLALRLVHRDLASRVREPRAAGGVISAPVHASSCSSRVSTSPTEHERRPGRGPRGRAAFDDFDDFAAFDFADFAAAAAGGSRQSRAPAASDGHAATTVAAISAAGNTAASAGVIAASAASAAGTTTALLLLRRASLGEQARHERAMAAGSE